MSMLEKFKNVGMDIAKSLADEPIGQQELRSTLKLLMTLENSGLKTAPLSVLQIMFETVNIYSRREVSKFPNLVLLMDLILLLIVLTMFTL